MKYFNKVVAVVFLLFVNFIVVLVFETLSFTLNLIIANSVSSFIPFDVVKLNS